MQIVYKKGVFFCYIYNNSRISVEFILLIRYNNNNVRGSMRGVLILFNKEVGHEQEQ